MNLNKILTNCRSSVKKLSPIDFLFSADKDLTDKIVTKQHYCGDMHIHPHNPYSIHIGEGVSSVTDIIKKACKTKMKVVAFTPHFALRSLRKIDQKVTYLNDLLSKGDNDCEPIIPIYGAEVGFAKHILVYVFGVNQHNANKIEKLGKTITHKTSLDSLVKIQDKFNNGCRVINGHTIPSGLGDVNIVIAPAHYKGLRGISKENILKFYEEGNDLLALETTNTAAAMFQCDLGDLLRKAYGSRGPTDLGGSDSHIDKNVGMSYTSFTVPKHKINDSMDIYDCIINHQTTSNYLRIPRLKQLILSKTQYLSPVYFVKFPIFLAVR